MVETKSEDIRRFFDLLGSIFCVLIYSLSIWKEEFRFNDSNKYFYLPLFIIIGLAIYPSFHYLIWHFLNTRFLFGYANFLFISMLSVSTAVLIGLIGLIGYFIVNQNISILLNRFGASHPLNYITEVVLFYWVTSLPMAFFWFIGILTAWRFSKKSFLR